MTHQTLPRLGGTQEPVVLRPLVPATVAVALGIGTGLFLPDHLLTAGVAAGLLSGRLMRNLILGRTACISLLLFCLCCGYFSIQPWLKNEWPADHVSHFVDMGKWRVSGWVAERPKINQRHVRFALRVHRLQQGADGKAVSGKILVTVRTPAPAVHRGDFISFSGHLRSVHSFCNPGGFDYERFLGLKGISTRLYTAGKGLRIERQGEFFFTALTERWRSRLAERMVQALAGRNTDAVQLLKALTLGDRDGISNDLRDAFSRAGVSHVLAISGLHVGMVAAAAFALFNYLLVWLPPLRAHGLVRRSAAALSIVPVVGYAVMAGLSPSTQRAAIMVVFFLATFWVGRRNDWFNTLAVAALLILVISPPQLTAVSFQLSFAAVMTILLGMRIFGRLQPDATAPWWRRWAFRPVALFLVSVLAILGTAPLVMRYFNQVAWVGPLTNLFVVPLVGVLVLPAGILGLLFVPLSPVVAAFCWHVAVYGLEPIVWLVNVIFQWPPAASTTVTPTIVEMGLFYLLLLVFLQWSQKRFRNVTLAVLLLAVIVDTVYWTHRRYAPELTVTAIDVGQGSANLLQLPGGKVVLIDGGGFSDNAAFDVGRSVVAPLLWRNKIKSVDLVILTHPNSDHLNGLLFILDHFNVGQIWSNHEKVDTMGCRLWRESITHNGIDHPPFAHLPRKAEYNGIKFEILGPPADYKRRRTTEPWRDPNNNSLVVRVTWGKISFLFCGDIEKRAEMDLLTRQGADAVGSTVMAVAHHGSRSSSSQTLLDAVRPEVAIISAGWRNRFHFPHETVLKRLHRAGCRVLRTDLCGAVQVTSDGRTYRVATCRQGCR